MNLVILFLIFSSLFTMSLYIFQKISNKLIRNFKLMLVANLIVYALISYRFFDIDLLNFIVMFVNLILYKFILLIILQGAISSIQLQALNYLNKFGTLNKKTINNDIQIFEQRFKLLKKSKILKILRTKIVMINKKSIIFVYYFFLILKKIYKEKM